MLIGLDQFVGSIFGIDCDLTISGFVGWCYPGSFIESFINFLFQDPNHCKDSIEMDIINRDYKLDK